MRQVDRMIVPSCHGPLNQGKKYISIQLMTRETLYCIVEAKTKVQEVLDEIGSYIGIKDIYLFGLATYTDNEYIFLSQENKLSKYAPKQWKAQNNHGLDGTGRPTVSLYLRIQFYVDCHLLIREKVARYHYYLQLRENVLKYHQRCSDEHYFLLSSHALQADIGNYIEEEHTGQYFVVEEYFPPWVIDRLGKDYIIQNMPSMHKDVYGLGRGEAQMTFISQASYINNPFNIHIHKLLTKKNDTRNYILLAVSPKGVELYVNKPDGFMELLTIFLWNDIKKLCFEKKKFEIRVASYPDIRKYTYYASSDEKARYLLHLCKVTHQLIMALKPKIVELKTRQEDVKKIYRESYIYSDNFDLAWEQEHGSLSMSYKDFGTLPKTTTGHKDQRISVISNASSNTTSGIVSDRVQSLDGSEDDLDLEVMIDCPAAESTESLPAAMSQDKQWHPLPCYRSSSASDFAYDDYKLNFLSTKKKCNEPVSEHSNQRASIATVSRNDSSSSYQSISTVRSCTQKNTVNHECCKSCLCISSGNCSHQLKSAKEARISLSLNSLPKMDVLGYFDFSFGQNNHRKDPSCENKHDSINERISPVIMQQHETSTVCAAESKLLPVSLTHPNMRILTSISGVPAPVVPPSNINFQMPHIRTKIGVSSLSRPAHGGKLSLSRNETDTLNNNKSKVEPQPFKNSPTSNLPPTPLFNSEDDTLPKYEPVILPMELTNVSKITNQSTTPAKVHPVQSGEKCSDLFQRGLDLSDSIHSNDSEFQLDVQDYFIPPPPLYANSTSSLGSDLQDLGGVVAQDDEITDCSLKHVNVPFWLPLSSPGFAAKTKQERSKLAALQNVNVDLSFEEDCNNNIGNDLMTSVIPPPPINSNQSFEDVRKDRSKNLSIPSSENLSGNPGDNPTLDIATLRKRSRDLDLPLITALCNDQSLMTLTPSRRTSLEASNLSVTPLLLNRPVSWHLGSDTPLALQEMGGVKVKNGLCHACNNSLPFALPEMKSLAKASSVNCLTKYSITPTMVTVNFDTKPNNPIAFNRNSADISIA